LKPRVRGRPRGRHLKLDDAIIRRIAAGIRKGAFPRVAAVAAGMAAPTFYKYLGLARQELDEPFSTPFCQADRKRRRLVLLLARAVEEAGAGARRVAESRVFKEDPKFWLKVGPGRDRGDPSNPGWTDRVEHVGPGGAPLIPPRVEFYLPSNGRGDERPAELEAPPVVLSPLPAPEPEE
jgi:hypothetical protein